MTRAARLPAAAAPNTAPVSPRPVRPVLFFAGLGALFLLLGCYEWGSAYLAAT